MKIGLDFHGVANALPFLRELSKLLVEEEHEVHIITGEQDSTEFRKQLDDLDIWYTHLFSVTTYHIDKGTKVTFDENGNPWMDGDVWDKTKAEYCELHNIDLHLDDSSEYGKFFKTPYARIIDNEKVS